MLLFSNIENTNTDKPALDRKTKLYVSVIDYWSQMLYFCKNSEDCRYIYKMKGIYNGASIKVFVYLEEFTWDLMF